jgi:hypothetical protein
LCTACERGDPIDSIIKHGGIHTNHGLYHACLGGHRAIVELVIERGRRTQIIHLNYGLYGACAGGHLDIAQMMIERGANVITLRLLPHEHMTLSLYTKYKNHLWINSDFRQFFTQPAVFWEVASGNQTHDC